MLCRNCGVDMVAGAAFCPSCGKAAGQSFTRQGGGPQSAAARAPRGLKPNIAGLLCYVVGFITGIFFLIAEPYKRDHFVRFHAFQAIFLSAVWIVLNFAVRVVSAIAPGMFWRATWMPHLLLGFAFLLLWVFLMYEAYKNEEFKLPVIGRIAALRA